MDKELLISEAFRLHERVSRRLEKAQEVQRKMPPRAARTTASAALQGRINRLRDMQKASLARYIRRKNNG